MNKINFMKLAEKAFAQLQIDNEEHVSPVDLVSELQKEMKQLAVFTNDYDDLAEMNADESFDWTR